MIYIASVESFLSTHNKYFTGTTQPSALASSVIHPSAAKKQKLIHTNRPVGCLPVYLALPYLTLPTLPYLTLPYLHLIPVQFMHRSRKPKNRQTRHRHRHRHDAPPTLPLHFQFHIGIGIHSSQSTSRLPRTQLHRPAARQRARCFRARICNRASHEYGRETVSGYGGHGPWSGRGLDHRYCRACTCSGAWPTCTWAEFERLVGFALLLRFLGVDATLLPYYPPPWYYFESCIACLPFTPEFTCCFGRIVYVNMRNMHTEYTVTAIY